MQSKTKNYTIMVNSTSLSSQESIFGGISILKENLIALVKKAIEEHTKTKKYNELCVEQVLNLV